jgi:hypothetical protein
MAQKQWDCPQPIEEQVNQRLQEKPGLKEFYNRLKESILTYPEQALPEIIPLVSGKKIKCRRKSVRATSYSKHMVFSKDEITVLYEILEDRIRVIGVYFP